MRPFLASFFLTLSWAALCLAQPLSGGWLTPGDFGSLHTVVPEDTTAAELDAAKVFADYWEQRTGQACQVSTKNRGLINVWIGRSAVQVNLVDTKELQSLGEGGFIIRGFTPSRREREMGAGKQLAIAALSDAGTMNGVHEFLSRYLGIRWIYPGQVGVPKTQFSLNDVNCEFHPCFRERQSGFSALFSGEGAGEYLRARRLSCPLEHAPSGEGSFYSILPPERFFAAHPEYYAEIGGARIAWSGWRNEPQATPPPGMAGQLCCANPEVAAAIVQEIATLYNAGPSPAEPELELRRAEVLRGENHNVVDLSPMPWEGACDCALCSGIDAREGSRAGSLLTLANRVAQGLRETLPGAAPHVHVLLPPYARRPPATLRPDEGVRIELSMRGCDYLRPLGDAQSLPNAAFVKDLRGWSRIAATLHIRDFGTNMANPLRPHPNLHVLQDNYQLFDRLGITGVHVQARSEGERGPGDFDAFRSYIVSEALWDPDLPFEHASEHFSVRYYGASARSIREYWELLLRRATNRHVYLHSRQDLHWLDYDTVCEAETLFRDALSARVSDDVRVRLERDYLGLQYAALVCPPRITAQEGRLILERPPAPTLDELIAKLNGYGTDSEPAIARLRSECGGITPPRTQEVVLTVLEDDAQLVWIAPSLHGAVVRWQNKENGHELLRGYTSYGAGPALLHEVRCGGDPDSGTFAPEYELVEHTSTNAVLRARRDDGLILTRTIALGQPGAGVSIAINVKNEGTTSVNPYLTLRGELTAQGSGAPEFWTRGAEAWERQPTEQPPENPYQSRADGASAKDSAIFFPSASLSVVLSLEEGNERHVRFMSDMQPSAPIVQADVPITIGAVPAGGSQGLRMSLRAVGKSPAELTEKSPAWAM